MSKTIVEKILSRASGVDAHAGQIVTAPETAHWVLKCLTPTARQRCATLSA